MQQETLADIYSTEGRDKDFKLNTEQHGPQRERRKLTASEIIPNSESKLRGKRRRGGKRKGNLKEKGKRRKRLETGKEKKSCMQLEGEAMHAIRRYGKQREVCMSVYKYDP